MTHGRALDFFPRNMGKFQSNEKHKENRNTESTETRLFLWGEKKQKHVKKQRMKERKKKATKAGHEPKISLFRRWWDLSEVFSLCKKKFTKTRQNVFAHFKFPLTSHEQKHFSFFALLLSVKSKHTPFWIKIAH